ncbi:MAG: class I SAM-dependent methyltransferase [Elusimicrobiota bacterium]
MNWFNIYAQIYDPFMTIFKFYKHEKVLSYLKPAKADKILDVGGGTGFVANKIRPFVKEIVVLDNSQKMLNQAKRYEGLTLCHAKAQEIPFMNNYFDAVICIDALHHIKYIDEAIKEIRRVLKVNGKIVILEFEIKGVKGKLFWLFEKMFVDNSKFVSSIKLADLMNDNGFDGEIITVSSLEYLYTGHKQ